MLEEIKENGFRSIYKGVAPFMRYTKGFGYMGVLLESEENGKLQCHMCGEAANNLSKHIYHKHKGMTPKGYRIQTGLNLGTPLMSETTRKLLKDNFLNLNDDKRQEIIERLRGLNRKLHKGFKKQRTAVASIEMNNRYGTCPEQVRQQFWDIYKSLDRLPNWKELSGKLRYIIETRFGSYQEAVIVWGVPKEEYTAHITNAKIKAVEARRDNNFFPKYNADEVKKQYQDFFALKNRFPTWGEVKQNGLPSRAVFERVFGATKSEVQNTL